MMLPVDMRLWVDKDHPAWFVIDVIGDLGAAALRVPGRPGKGRPGHGRRLSAVLPAARACHPKVPSRELFATQRHHRGKRETGKRKRETGNGEQPDAAPSRLATPATHT
jgi:hypothetical protein